jgi:putative nucleotidyltransferase with HDIG domain
MGSMILSSVFVLVKFSRDVYKHCMPLISTNEIFIVAIGNLRAVLMEKDENQKALNGELSHYIASNQEFKAALSRKEVNKILTVNNEEIFRVNQSVLEAIRSNNRLMADELLAKLNELCRKLLTQHKSELETRQRRVSYFSYGIAGLCGLIVFYGIFVSFRERQSMEIKKNAAVARSAIRSLIKALEARDEYTKGHSTRVVSFAMRVAKNLGLEKAELETVRLAALLHDIGKIGVPDKILLKAGKLTDEEFARIKDHPVIGVNLLKKSSSLSHVLPTIRHHHERVDGRGYPDGLRGDEIPITAQCVAIADAYDAMTSSRPYRSGMSRTKALREIKRCRDTQWAGNVVDAFLEFMTNEKVKKAMVQMPVSAVAGKIGSN